MMLKRYRMVGLLGAALVLVWLNVGSPNGGEVVSAVQRHVAVSAPRAPAAAVSFPDRTLNLPPDALSRSPLEPALRDPFAPEAPPPVVVAKPPPAPPVQIAPPPPPEPPPLNMTYAGRMTAPNGSLVVYVSIGDNSIALSPGQSLPNGYRVEAIKERAIELSYPALNRTARLELPAPQKYETR